MWRLRRDRGFRSQLFWHSLSHIRRFSPLRMTKRGDARRSVDRRFSSYRQPSPRGEGAPKGRIGHRRHEREWGKSVSSRRFMKAPYPPLTRSPFPNGEGLGGATLRVNLYKERSPIKNHSRPFLWKGRIGHRRYEREWGKSVSSVLFTKAPYPPLRGPPSPMGKAKRCGALRRFL